MATSKARRLELLEVKDILKVMQEQVQVLQQMGKESKNLTGNFQDIAKNLERSIKSSQTQSQIDLDIQILRKKVAEEYSNITEKQLFAARKAHLIEAGQVRIGQSNKVKEIEAALKQKQHWADRISALEGASNLITEQQDEQKKFEVENNNWALLYLLPLKNLAKILRKFPGMSEVFRIDRKGLAQMGKDVSKSLEGTKGIAEKVKVIGLEYGKWIKSLNIVKIGLLSIAAILVATIARFVKIDKITRTIRDTTGFTGDNLKTITKQAVALNLEFQKWGIDLEEAAKITTGLIKSFGSMGAVLDKDRQIVAQFSRLYGISGEEAASLYKTITDMSGGTSEMAESLLSTTYQMARLAKVSPQEVIRDMSKNSEFIATFTKGSGENMAEAAVQARKMGINLEIAAKIADGLLDFETSIRNQMEASFFVGRDINLDKARLLQFHGEEKAALVEIAKVMGTLEQFDNQSILAKQSLAKAAGMTVADLKHMLITQERLTAAGDDSLSTFTKIQKGVGLEELLGKGVRTDLEFFVDSLKNLGISLASVLIPLFKAVSPLLKSFGILINVVAGGFQILATGVETVVKGVGWLKDLLFPVEKGFKSSGKQIKFFTDLISLATIAVAAFWLISNPVGWVVAIAGAIGLVTKYWTNIMDFFKYIGNKIVEFYDNVIGKIMGIVTYPAKIMNSIFGDSNIKVPVPTTTTVETGSEMLADIKSINTINTVKPTASKAGSDSSDVVTALKEIKELLAEPAVINMDGRRVGEQISRRIPRKGGV